MMKIEHLNKTYDRRSANANQVLKDVSFTLPDTGFVCILGPSGCGKTSLLNVIGGLDRFDSGILELAGVRVSSYGTRAFEAQRNCSFGYIFQNYYLLQEHTVAYNVYLGLHSLKLSHAQKLERVREALAAVDMERYLRRKVSTLSGGQQQRIAIARALARRPRVIFADEPTGNLDEANTLNICTLLRKISKTSLVVMVTHEDRIAKFFADRIITLDAGRITQDSADWNRESLEIEGGNTLYAGDYTETRQETDGLTLRLLREEGAMPVDLTVLALKDRIVIKLADGRTIACGAPGDSPVLAEGKRPTLTLTTVEQEEVPFQTRTENVATAAGRGLGLGMMFAEAKSLMKGRGLRNFAAGFFMVVLTVLTLLTVGDYLTVSSVDPHDFVRTDSHILEVQVERGSQLEVTTFGLEETLRQYMDYYQTSGLEYSVMPHVSPVPQITTDIYLQLDEQELSLSYYSYVPLEYLKEDSLILGRMPEDPGEVVVDRWVLDAVLREDGILQNSIADISFFLDKTLNFPKKTYSAKIVGICDSGEAAMYMEPSAIVSVGVNGTGILTLSQLQHILPGEYDDVVLEPGKCLYINSENSPNKMPGNRVSLKKDRDYEILDTVELESYATVVVADSEMDDVIRDMLTDRFYLYCLDKAAVKAMLAQPMPEELAGLLQINVIDAYSKSWDAYNQASHLKADARTIVTVTVMVLAMVMLYLLRRTQVQQRIEMLAVYRLLGIPGRKLTEIFAMESCLSFLTSALPAAVVTWGAVTVLTGIEDLAFSLILPLGTAAVVTVGILIYHVLVSLIPLWRLLKLPPARLAAKYDF